MATEEPELSNNPKLKGVYVSKFKLKDKDDAAEEYKPCHKESMASLHCVSWRLRSECDEVIENYKRCQKFWDKVMKDRTDKGIFPALPPVKDREKVIDEYKHLICDSNPFFDRPM